MQFIQQSYFHILPIVRRMGGGVKLSDRSQRKGPKGGWVERGRSDSVPPDRAHSRVFNWHIAPKEDESCIFEERQEPIWVSSSRIRGAMVKPVNPKIIRMITEI